jgi:hypothetical protein
MSRFDVEVLNCLNHRGRDRRTADLRGRRQPPIWFACHKYPKNPEEDTDGPAIKL